MEMLKIKCGIYKRINPRHKLCYIDSIVKNGKLFDIGCGNNSPYIVKTLRPDIYYVGLDIGVYNQTYVPSRYANEFILTEAARFHEKIAEYPDTFDCVISAHNLEHCDDYKKVTSAMLRSLKKGGTIFISFPSEESIRFPHRKGTLNFNDDPTHKNPIVYSSFVSLLKQNGMKILFSTKRYRPFILFIIGLLFEPFSRFFDKPAPAGGTWALYGFETIIIAQKLE
jgi:SAM-dependent methyltransferase